MLARFDGGRFFLNLAAVGTRVDVFSNLVLTDLAYPRFVDVHGTMIY